MERIVYRSLPVGPPERALLDIVRVSERNNAGAGASGILFHDDRAYVQMIEGEDGAAARLMATIRRDPRHRIVWEVAFEPGERAISPGLPMGYVSAPECASCTTVRGTGALPTLPAAEAARAVSLLIGLAGWKYPSCKAA